MTVGWRKTLGQSINSAGVLSFLHMARTNPSLAIPHIDTPDLRNIAWKDLKEAGFEGCVFDKDNTLTEAYALVLHPFVKDALRDCIDTFGKDKVVLYSNSAGLEQYDPDGKEAEKMEDALGVMVLRHRRKKPAGDVDEVEAYFRCPAKKLVMVGDRYLTDVAFGNRLGMMTIRSRPFTSVGEPYAVGMARWIEERFVQRCRQKNIGPPPHPLLLSSE